MDEVANAGAIRRIVVVAEDLDFFALSGCRFTSDLDKVRRLRRRLSRASQRICPRHIAVAQGDIAQVMGAGGIPQHTFPHELARYGGFSGPGRPWPHSLDEVWLA